MDIETAREYCLAKKAVTECLPFDEYSLVMKVMDKMFVLIDLEGSNKICMKCDPEYAIELREHYSAMSRICANDIRQWKVLGILTRNTGTKSSLTEMWTIN